MSLYIEWDFFKFYIRVSPLQGEFNLKPNVSNALIALVVFECYPALSDPIKAAKKRGVGSPTDRLNTNVD